MIVSVLAAAVSLAAMPQADRDDLHCLAYLSVAVGKVDGAMREKVDGGALYYFGRIEARSPKVDIADALEQILKDPGYGPQTYEVDKARCRRQLDPLAARFGAWKDTYEGGK